MEKKNKLVNLSINQFAKFAKMMALSAGVLAASVYSVQADDAAGAAQVGNPGGVTAETKTEANAYDSSVFLRAGYLFVSGGSGPDLELGFKKRHLFTFMPEFLSRERLGFAGSYKKVSNSTSHITAFSGFTEIELRELFKPIFSVLPFYEMLPFFVSTQLGVASVEKTVRSTVTSGFGFHFLAQLHLPLPMARLHERLESEVLLRYSFDLAKVNLVGFSAGLNVGFQF